MAKSQQSYNKKEKEKKRRKKKQEKEERRAQRKAEREERGPLSFEDMLSYVDENGNITSTPPDPNKKKKEIKLEDIQLGAASQYQEPVETVRQGRVKFFNEEKGYGFIVDQGSKESIFVHINDLAGPLDTDDKVTFETEQGFKGLKAINVKLVK